MGLLKKSETARLQFQMPSLVDASPVYADLITKRGELHGRRSELSAEKRRLEQEILATPRKEYSGRVSELLGEPVEAESAPRRRVREIVGQVADIEAALAVIASRILAEKGAASSVVRQAVKPEYARRVQAMATAIEALGAASADYESLVDQFNAENVEWTGSPHCSLRSAATVMTATWSVGCVRQRRLATMHNERIEHASTDEKGLRKPGRRMIKLPGEKGHVERSDSAVYIARKLDLDKRERRTRTVMNG
ncbi:hypothetical protein NKH60_19315 [Mesorhizobium sp. M1006]|uniref:hypothetical protein n=1 Tax=Mesorhizobium sp. M1006 TaxID=2957048 RepID=UPI0033371397